MTLAKSGGAEILKVKFYGKGKASVYALDFESCEPSFKALAQTAKRVTFAKGASSAKVSAIGSKQAFLINVRQGQFIGAVAFGYSVKIYYPNGEIYALDENPDDELQVKEQTTNLDFSGSDAVPTSGDALILLEIAPEGTGKAEFFVKNTEKELKKAIEQAINSRRN